MQYPSACFGCSCGHPQGGNKKIKIKRWHKMNIARQCTALLWPLLKAATCFGYKVDINQAVYTRNMKGNYIAVV
jgi:hypothetical protein